MKAESGSPPLERVQGADANGSSRDCKNQKEFNLELQGHKLALPWPQQLATLVN